jgi:hypothetical protein
LGSNRVCSSGAPGEDSMRRILGHALSLVALVCVVLPTSASGAGPFVYSVDDGYPTYTNNRLLSPTLSSSTHQAAALHR